MKYRMVILTMLCSVVTLCATVRGDYYYSGGGQINLKIDSLKVAIKFDDGASKSSIIAAIGRIVDELDDENATC